MAATFDFTTFSPKPFEGCTLYTVWEGCTHFIQFGCLCMDLLYSPVIQQDDKPLNNVCTMLFTYLVYDTIVTVQL